jgi:hypothetical protein
MDRLRIFQINEVHPSAKKLSLEVAFHAEPLPHL